MNRRLIPVDLVVFMLFLFMSGGSAHEESAF